jgi:serine-aspartate repeat-containing protein C/D/E
MRVKLLGVLLAMTFVVLAVPTIASAYTVSGNKFVDNNADGIDAGSGDAGQNSVTIYADLNNNDTFDVGEPSAVTAGTGGSVGNYTLTVANNSAYTIREVQPAGSMCTIGTVGDFSTCEQVVGGPTQTANVTGINFGNAPLPLIAGTKFNDLNGNGTQDAGEGPLSGVTVYLDTNNDNIRQTGGGGEPSTTTSTSGKWGFTGLAAGTYTVREVQPANTLCTTPGAIDYASPDPNCEFSSTVAAGQASTGNTFGNAPTGAITGTKFEDNDVDGVKDGNSEAGINGVTIYADLDNSNSVDSGEPSTVTAGSGNSAGTYTLNVLPGTYTIREVLPAGYECSTGGVGDFSTCEQSATVAAGGTTSGKDFGNFRRASITGLKFNDTNGNGVQDLPDEQPIAGVTIYLDGSGSTAANDSFDADETFDVTEADGTYSFTNLLPGNYSVREVPPTGTSCTFPGGTDASCEYNHTPLASGANITTDNFGNAAPGSISGTKFEDLNGDGIKNGSEGPLSGVTIYVDSNNNDTLDVGETSAVTASDGTWTLTNVPAGTRTVREVQPTNYTCTAPGTVGDFSTCEFAVPVISNQTATGNYDFGNAPLPKISGTKFHDLDADGTDDAGTDPPISGVTIYLDLNGDNALGTGQNAEPSTTTDGNGNYSLSVAPGTYTVREKVPNNSGYVCSTPGTIDFADPDLDCEYNDVTVTLGGADATGNNFGNFKPVSITGTKFHDLNADGSKTGAEPVLSGWKIYLDTNDNDVMDAGTETDTAQTTDASGNYSFTNLLPGNYTVREDPQDTWHCSTPGSPTTNDSPDADCEYSLSLSSGTDSTGRNFGNFQFVSVSGTKFNDQDFSGTNNGEPPIEGVQIYLDSDGDDTLDAGEPTVNTAADGTWSFINLVPGSYTEREVEPTGYLCSAPSTTFAQCEFSQTLTSGAADNTGQDFGNVQSATFSGTKFNDANANGVNDGEGPLSGVQIYLDGTGGQLADDIYEAGEATTTTDATGAWSIGGLYPGTYTAREVVPSGYECTAPSSTFANCEFTETLTPGQNSSALHDFGNHLIPAPPGGGGGGGGGTGGTGGGGTGGTSGTTVSGTAKSDQLTGTPGNDVIIGGAGNDIINCGGGKDTVLAGAGNDVVNCGAGNDIVSGGPGNDLLRGQAGNDTLKGQGGKDKLIGAAGNDTLLGGSGIDVLKPGSGKNKVKQ